MNADRFAEIKKLAVLALFADDELREQLVLKGGNALDIGYGIAARSSIDLDFSMSGGFSPTDIDALEAKIAGVLGTAFLGRGYTAFDIRFRKRPKVLTLDMEEFWGGYRIEFKLIDTVRYEQLENDPRKLRLAAYELGAGEKRAFKIDISKHEYCDGKRTREIDGVVIYLYSPEMLVFEKLRAICQQMPEYTQEVVNPSRSARARDFFDIHTVLTNFRTELTSPAHAELLARTFGAKRVPLRLIGLIPDYREIHRPDFASVIDTVKPWVDLKSFDYYFDYVMERCCKPLEPFWRV